MQTLKNKKQLTQVMEEINQNNAAPIKPALLIKLPTLNIIGSNKKSTKPTETVPLLKKALLRVKHFWDGYCELNRLFVKYHTLPYYYRDVNNNGRH